jgi:hypothetical protein
MTSPAAVRGGRPALTKLFYKIPEAAGLLSMSRSVLYEEMRAGRLRPTKRGRATLISADAIADYYDALLGRGAGAAR